MVDLDSIKSHYNFGVGPLPNHVQDLVDEVGELRQKCADLASGDPQVRNVLLREFGTTDPELLSDQAKESREWIRELRAQNAKMLAVLDKLWADKDAPQEDQAAARRLYNAWLDLRDVRNEMHAGSTCQTMRATPVSEECSEELRQAFASLPPDQGQIQVLSAEATYERIENPEMLAALEAAYDHLDTYGFPNHPDEVLMASQKNVFGLLRPFVNRPKPGSL